MKKQITFLQFLLWVVCLEILLSWALWLCFQQGIHFLLTYVKEHLWEKNNINVTNNIHFECWWTKQSFCFHLDTSIFINASIIKVSQSGLNWAARILKNSSCSFQTQQELGGQLAWCFASHGKNIFFHKKVGIWFNFYFFCFESKCEWKYRPMRFFWAI